MTITCPEDISAPVAPGGKLSIVARTTVGPIGLGAELLVDERRATLGADEAGLVPVLLLVREVLQNGKLRCDKHDACEHLRH